MLNAKLCRGYWSEGQVLRIGQASYATLWTQITSVDIPAFLSRRVRDLGKNKKGGHTGRPIPNREETSALLLLFGGLLRRRWSGRLCRRRRRVWCARHAFFEIPYSFAQPTHHLGDFPAPEQNENHDRHYHPMNWTFKHKLLPISRTKCVGCNPNSGLLKPQVWSTEHTYRITRSSPVRRVTRSRSRYSSRGMAYFRVIPVSSLNADTETRSPFAFL